MITRRTKYVLSRTGIGDRWNTKIRYIFKLMQRSAKVKKIPTTVLQQVSHIKSSYTVVVVVVVVVIRTYSVIYFSFTF